MPAPNPRVQYNEVDPEVWRGARLSAILRAVRADAAVILTAGCTRRFPVLPTPAVEEAVLADVVDMYTSGEARERGTSRNPDSALQPALVQRFIS